MSKFSLVAQFSIQHDRRIQTLSDFLIVAVVRSWPSAVRYKGDNRLTAAHPKPLPTFLALGITGGVEAKAQKVNAIDIKLAIFLKS